MIETTVFISTDRDLLDMDLVMTYLTQVFWHSESRPEQISNAIEHSLCFGLYKGKQQLGFARVVTDYTFFAWLADVFIVPGHPRSGYGQFFMRQILAHPLLIHVKRWRLATKDAHHFYAKFGFARTGNHERLMER